MEPSKTQELPVGFEDIEDVDATKLQSQIQEIIRDTEGKAGGLIRVLQQVQDLIGYLPSSVIEYISKELEVPLSSVYGIVSFYHFFTMVPKGRNVIQVCMGTSCYVKGGKKILAALKKNWGLESETTTPDKRYSLEMVRCLGCCGLSPVIAIGGDVHRKVKPNQLQNILSYYK